MGIDQMPVAEAPRLREKGEIMPTFDVMAVMEKNIERFEKMRERLEKARERLKKICPDAMPSDECSMKAKELYHNALNTVEKLEKDLSLLEAKCIPGKKVVQTAIRISKTKEYNPTCCWDWMDHIYKSAGVQRKRIYDDHVYRGRNCGTHHASEELVDQIVPGDRIYFNNQNTSDDYGNHSVIFLEWIDREKRQARVASGYANHPGRIHEIFLREKEPGPNRLSEGPVTLISRAVFSKRQEVKLAKYMDTETQKMTPELTRIDELMSKVEDQLRLASLEDKIGT